MSIKNVGLLIFLCVCLQLSARDAGAVAPPSRGYTSVNKLPAPLSDAAPSATVSDPLSPAESPALPVRKSETENQQPVTTSKPNARDNTPVEPEELSSIEKAVSAGTASVDLSAPQPYQARQLTQYGYNFFRPAAAGFAPLTDIPVGEDYVLAPGDRIILNFWGSIEGTHELEVNRSGEIVLPGVGSLRVWGLPFGKLHDIVKARLAKTYRNFDLNVTMGKLRVIKVFVVGEVTTPGDYSLSPLSTLINALGAAGGPLKTGSLRKIQVKRGGTVVETVDLYDFFLNGDKSRDIRLRNGDTIFIPVIGKVAGIGGNVRRPAIYELRDEKNLHDLINLAEGLLPTGYLQRVQISRVQAYEKKAVADFSIDPKGTAKSLEQIMDGIAIQDMDSVSVFPINVRLRDHVRLVGYVLRPGDYALKPGMRVSQLLEKDNLLPDFYKEGAEITRLYPPDYKTKILFIDLAKALAGDPAHDLELKEFDKVKIFSRWEMQEMPTVRLNGEVQRPGQYRLFDDMTVRDLVMEAGNLKISAYTKNAELVRLQHNGETVTSVPMTIDLEGALKGDPKDNIPLHQFDSLTVRRIPDWTEETERYVTLQGEVRFPGVYAVSKGEKMSSVIQRAGGFTGKAFLEGAKFTRKSVQEDQQKRMDEFIARTEQQILQKQGELAALSSSKEDLEAAKASLEALTKSLEKLKTAKAEGRMIIHLAQLNSGSSAHDMEMAGGDVLQIPTTPNSVNVLGQVYNPATHMYVNGKTADYYLKKAGGPTREAAKKEMYIVRANGTVVSREQTRFGFFWKDENDSWNFGSFLSARMGPGDTLVVPQEMERTPLMRDIKDIATILGQVALTAGVLIAAGL